MQRSVMSRLAEALGHGEEGRVLRSHASKVASPNAKQLVYSRKKTEGGTKPKKKKVLGVKRAPVALVAEQGKRQRKSTATKTSASPKKSVSPKTSTTAKTSATAKKSATAEKSATAKKSATAEKSATAKKSTTIKKSTTVVVAETAVVSSTTLSSTSAWSVSLSSEDAIAEATKHLLAADAKFGSIVSEHGAPGFKQEGSSFTALVKSIVYQQLAGKAAATIHGRLVALCGGPESVTPAVVAALTAEELRAIGISGRKADYLHDLAAKFLSEALSDEKLAVMSEDDLVTALTAVKGIGVWSAHMFMIFHLHKPDVLPVGDLGIRRGFQKLYKLKKEPSAAEMQALALSWRPYRSLAAWYLWRVQ